MDGDQPPGAPDVSQFRVNVKVVDCWTAVDVAVTVIIEVVGVVVVPPPPLAPPPPPQPVSGARIITRTNDVRSARLRRRLNTPMRPARATTVPPGKNGCKFCCIKPAWAEAVNVSCVVFAESDGVTVVGLNEQVTPDGSPEQEKLMVELKPF
jgi:hypothetical protein